MPMWIKFKFYNIIIKSGNVDKGEGGKTLIYKMWIKSFSWYPSLVKPITDNEDFKRVVRSVQGQGPKQPKVGFLKDTAVGRQFFLTL